ncbi:MAG TPA: hypothetical protein PK231_11530, partial [Acidocella sp.]|nr:hypothetical protein [Acidocella sp.]
MINNLVDRLLIVPRATRIVLSGGRAQAGMLGLFLIFLGFYAMLLPATSTGGAVGLVSLQFLTIDEFGLAVLMAVLLALTMMLGIHGISQGGRANSTGSVIGAVLAVTPSLLCCSPILPLTIAAIASILPAAGAFGLPIQGFIATHEAWIYGVAIALMAWGLYSNARRALFCAC